MGPTMGHDPISEEAALWRVRLAAGTANRAALEDWLREDPRRRARFEEVEAVWGFFDEVRNHPEMRRLRQLRTERSQDVRRRRRRVLGLAAAASVAVASLIAGGLLWTGKPLVLESSDRGREVVQLSDGSRVTLDLRSRLEVRYSLMRRDLTLTAGQAYFCVARNKLRPFTVFALGRAVVATGTAFNVDLQGKTLAVALLKGHVRITGAARETGAGANVELSPGQALVAGPGELSVSSFDPGAVLAWQAGRLVFSDVSLGEAIERENRYAERPVTLDDPRLKGLRLSGVFNAGDTRAFAEAVSTMLPVAARFQRDGAVDLSARRLPKRP